MRSLYKWRCKNVRSDWLIDWWLCRRVVFRMRWKMLNCCRSRTACLKCWRWLRPLCSVRRTPHHAHICSTPSELQRWWASTYQPSSLACRQSSPWPDSKPLNELLRSAKFLTIAAWTVTAATRKRLQTANLRQAAIVHFVDTRISFKISSISPVSVGLPNLVTLNHGRDITMWRFSLRQFWPWTVTLTSEKLNNEIWHRFWA